jgi:hypothetical protein
MFGLKLVYVLACNMCDATLPVASKVRIQSLALSALYAVIVSVMAKYHDRKQGLTMVLASSVPHPLRKQTFFPW